MGEFKIEVELEGVTDNEGVIKVLMMTPLAKSIMRLTLRLFVDAEVADTELKSDDDNMVLWMKMVLMIML